MYPNIDFTHSCLAKMEGNIQNVTIPLLWERWGNQATHLQISEKWSNFIRTPKMETGSNQRDHASI